MNGVPETLPMVFCNNCSIHHHPHHHCGAHSRCNKPTVIKENYVYVSNTPQVTTKSKALGKVTSVGDLNFYERNQLRSKLDKHRKWIDYNDLSKYYK